MLPILASGNVTGIEIDIGFSGTRIYPILFGAVDEFHSYCMTTGSKSFLGSPFGIEKFTRAFNCSKENGDVLLV